MIQQTQTKQIAKLPASPREITIVRLTPKVARAEGTLKAAHGGRAEPSAREAYGCVEWFSYQKHPLDTGT